MYGYLYDGTQNVPPQERKTVPIDAITQQAPIWPIPGGGGGGGSNIRDSQDLVLTVKKSSVSNIRDSQDVILVVQSIVAHVRVSQDVLLVIYQSAVATSLQVFDEDGGQYPRQYYYNFGVHDQDNRILKTSRNQFSVSFIVT